MAGPSSDDSFDIGAFLDRQRLGRMQLVVLSFAALVTLFDGFDTYVMAFLLVPIAKAFSVAPASIAPVLLLQAIGLSVGAYGITPLSDRFGRRTVALGCLLGFGLLTLLVTRVTTIAELSVLRFMTGLFLGAAVPTMVAVMDEVSPKRVRGTTIALISAATALGSIVAAIVSAYLVPRGGWTVPLLIGGLAPLLAMPFVFRVFPESARFLAARDARDPRIAPLLRRYDARLNLESIERFSPGETMADGRAGVAALFAQGRLRATLAIWALYFTSGLILAFLGQFFPTILHAAGHIDLAEASKLTALFGLCGMTGTLAVGALSDRIEARSLLVTIYCLGTLALVMLGSVGRSGFALPLAIAAVGLSITPTIAVINRLAARMYPTAIRGTGLGWAWGASRLGGIVAPIVGGVVLHGHMDMLQTFGIIAIFAAFGALGAASLRTSSTRAVEGTLFSAEPVVG